MGVGRRTIRMSILKELLIQRRIAFPIEQDVVEAEILEKRIVHGIRKKNSEAVKSIFAELDSFIEGIVMQKSNI